MIIFFATSNRHKVASARAALSPLGHTVEMIEMEFTEGREEDPKIIAIDKAKQAWEYLHKPVIVEDGGFFIDALGGFPMTHVKFSLQTLGVKHILKMLEGETNRSAEWRMSLAYVFGDDRVETFTFVNRGHLTQDIRPELRECWTDFWRIWVRNNDNPKQLAISELTGDDLQQYDRWWKDNSHYVMFAKWLEQQGV